MKKATPPGIMGLVRTIPHEAVNICIWRLVGRFCLEIQIELKDNEEK